MTVRRRASTTCAWWSCTPRPRWRWCRRCTRASRCRRWRPWPAACRWSATTGGALPEVVGRRRRDRACWCRPATRARWPRPSARPSTTPTCAGAAWARPAGQRVLERFTGGRRAEATVDAATGQVVDAGRCTGADRRADDARRARPARRPGARPRLRRRAATPSRPSGGAPTWWRSTATAASSRTWPAMFGRHAPAGEAPAGRARGTPSTATRSALPFADGAFDRVIAAEVLEHVPDDAAAMAELARVLRPGGTLAVTVPRWFPEQVCWALTDGLPRPRRARRPRPHLPPRRARGPAGSAPACGRRRRTTPTPCTRPYWWLRCAVGLDRPDRLAGAGLPPLPGVGHRRRPRSTRAAERALDPVLGKSLVLYAGEAA